MDISHVAIDLDQLKYLKYLNSCMKPKASCQIKQNLECE